METEESIDVTNSQEVTCYGSPVGSREHNHSEDTEVTHPHVFTFTVRMVSLFLASA